VPGELERSNSCTVCGDSFEFFKIEIPSMIDDNMSRVISAVRHRERAKIKDLTTGPSVRRNSYRMPLVEVPSVRFDTDMGLSPTNMVISGEVTEPAPSN
jgi:hypothetical protein